jgi:hypothetical protein
VYLLRRVAEPHLRSSFQPWPFSLYSCWLPQELLLLSWHSFDQTWLASRPSFVLSQLYEE